jgi:hypothetical protein
MDVINNDEINKKNELIKNEIIEMSINEQKFLDFSKTKKEDGDNFAHCSHSSLNEAVEEFKEINTNEKSEINLQDQTVQDNIAEGNEKNSDEELILNVEIIKICVIYLNKNIETKQ